MFSFELFFILLRILRFGYYSVNYCQLLNTGKIFLEEFKIHKYAYPCDERAIVPDKLCLSKVSPNSFNSSNAFALLSIFSSPVLVTSSIKYYHLKKIIQ